jgi:hypothetical protein
MTPFPSQSANPQCQQSWQEIKGLTTKNQIYQHHNKMERLLLGAQTN